MSQDESGEIRAPEAADARDLAQTLQVLATALAGTRERLDHMEAELLDALPARSLRPREWQNIDRIGQRLDDIARALEHLARTVPETACPQAPLLSTLTLEEIRALFDPRAHPTEPSPSSPSTASGGATLF